MSFSKKFMVTFLRGSSEGGVGIDYLSNGDVIAEDFLYLFSVIFAVFGFEPLDDRRLYVNSQFMLYRK